MKILRSLLLLMAFAPVAMAEQLLENDKYIVHYNAFNSTVVAPEVAQRHGLKRSRYSAMLNVAVFEKTDAGQKAIPATISGKVQNLIQQSQTLAFKPIKEGDALYYIGSFNFGNEEVLHVTLDVRPEGAKSDVKIRFDQKFYTD
ncbi:DUF4426 domain-containing protein [Neptunomonas sp. XY-337]|uniref:DUF4426 domain-containing protein n=1 Tax=Neptunomonas sp. XY-337 TaxID=2561897 RepID=UPI0010AA051A|nr:DUF4426 domain-containing protein [Neptunomonas sp. XY-337]